MTKIEKLQDIATYIPADRADLLDFVEQQIQQVIRKNSYVSPNADKPTAKQAMNAALKCDILCTIARMGKPVTLHELMDNTQSLVDANASVQKVSALMTQLVNDGEVVRSVDKRVSYFALPVADEQ